MTSREIFLETLEREYTSCFEFDKDYAYVKTVTTPKALAEKMVHSLIQGTADKNGKSIKRTCTILGIPHSYKAISAYILGE